MPTVGVIVVTCPTSSEMGSDPNFSTLARTLASSTVNSPVTRSVPPAMGSLKYGELYTIGVQDDAELVLRGLLRVELR